MLLWIFIFVLLLLLLLLLLRLINNNDNINDKHNYYHYYYYYYRGLEVVRVSGQRLVTRRGENRILKGHRSVTKSSSLMLTPLSSWNPCPFCFDLPNCSTSGSPLFASGASGIRLASSLSTHGSFLIRGQRGYPGVVLPLVISNSAKN